MVSTSRDRVEATLRRIRQSEALWMRGVTPMIPDLTALSILIIEKDSDNRDVFATFLRACGARVVATGTVDGALRYLDTTSVHVIMSDVSMLPAGGAAFVEAIRGLARHRHTPILAVTGWTEKDVRPAECGFTAFMQKPVDLDRLGAEILRLSRAAAAGGR
jgi:CheY-like chemotaxis protein